MLSRIEASLDTVLDGVSDIIAAAEMLGTVHQVKLSCNPRLALLGYKSRFWLVLCEKYLCLKLLYM